ncbi:MAG: hypothetical protein MRZ79_23695 [Bacteroidia bacterium]|nr:hypothetical protein [Bacteroidia bacterium]
MFFPNIKWLSCLVFLIPFFANAQLSKGDRVLFVGNSYTYFWNLPQSVEVLSDEGKAPLTCLQSLAGGANLGQHYRGEKKLKTLEKIKAANYDALILQDHSRQAVDHPDSLFHYAKLLIVQARESQPKVKLYLYMTWAREWDPYMQESITREYNRLGKETGATVVPAGLAWKRARELRPGFPLYDADKSHPSPLGTYLNACVFYRVLTGKSPIDLPERIVAKDKDGEKLYLNIQSKENALFCQKVADEVVDKFEKSKGSNGRE